MKSQQVFPLCAAALGILSTVFAGGVSAQTSLLTADKNPSSTTSSPLTVENPSPLEGWTFGVAPYTLHFSDAKQENAWEPEDQKHSYVWLVQAEKALDTRHFAGLALFSNSFGQPTQYAYYGWRFQPFDSAPKFYAKLTAGVIHGYKYPYHEKIPLNNRHGWGITAIPAVGYDFTPNWGAQVNILGTAGLMFQLNYTVR